MVPDMLKCSHRKMHTSIYISLLRNNPLSLKVFLSEWSNMENTYLAGQSAEKDWGQEEKGTTEGEMAGWHRRLDGHGFGWTPGVGDGQGGLVCRDSWGRKELDTTE